MGRKLGRDVAEALVGALRMHADSNLIPRTREMQSAWEPMLPGSLGNRRLDVTYPHHIR